MKIMQEIRRASLFERILRPAKLHNTVEVDEVFLPEDETDVVSRCVRAETAALIREADKAQSELITTSLKRPFMLAALNVPAGYAMLANPEHTAWIIEHMPVETPRGRAEARLMSLDIHQVEGISRIYVLRHDPGFFDRKAMKNQTHRFKLWLKPTVRIVEVGE